MPLSSRHPSCLDKIGLSQKAKTSAGLIVFERRLRWPLFSSDRMIAANGTTASTRLCSALYILLTLNCTISCLIAATVRVQTLALRASFGRSGSSCWINSFTISLKHQTEGDPTCAEMAS